MWPAGGTVPEDGSGRRILSVWAVPVVILVGLWLWLAFSSGGYIAHQWLPPSLAVGLFGLVVSLLVAYPRRPRQLSVALLALFGSYGVWVAFSALWADSVTRVWMESGRTFSYLLVFALAVVYFADPAARQAFRYLLMAGAFVLLIACVWQLWSAESITGFFIEDRFSYPVSYPNNAGALFLVAFWPLMWLASGPEERAPVRGVALGLATGLLGLAILTQSRGAIWSLAISVIFMFVISPARLRLLLYLVVPALLMVYEFPRLNRYWLEGAEAVSGGVGARTLVMAAITAGFIGMILALLERWVKVSRRMKAIFGTIVLVGALAGSIYGAFAYTSDIGGPLKWISQTWRQFTGQTDEQSDTAGSSRFTLVSSSGRVDIWRVAWHEFESVPLLGVGADNFVFQYDRLRTESYKPQQAHSLELQVLGETGVVGGIFVFGGILLAAGGLLWPRCTAGWRRARETWLRRPEDAKASRPSEASPRWCRARWGNDPKVYGWEMALLAGSAYWLIHASVDWLWQMAGVSIPALLFVAAGAAGVDARVGVLWPRINRWLRLRAPETPRETPDLPLTGQDSDAAAAGISRQERRMSRKRHRRRSVEMLRPPGLMSHVFRALLVTLSLVVIVGAGLPYLAFLYQDSASALAATDGVGAIERAESAHWLQPTDPGPYLTKASIYTDAARFALDGGSPDNAGAVFDNLALALSSQEEAIALEPVDWMPHYRAGVTALNLLLAEGYAAGLNPELDYAALASAVPGLADWSALLGHGDTVPDPGIAGGSLAVTAETREVSAYYRGLSRADLAQSALDFLSAAQERNPLATQAAEAEKLVRQIQSI